VHSEQCGAQSPALRELSMCAECADVVGCSKGRLKGAKVRVVDCILSGREMWDSPPSRCRVVAGAGCSSHIVVEVGVGLLI
jgi:hypothetical protein